VRATRCYRVIAADRGVNTTTLATRVGPCGTLWVLWVLVGPFGSLFLSSKSESTGCMCMLCACCTCCACFVCTIVGLKKAWYCCIVALLHCCIVVLLLLYPQVCLCGPNSYFCLIVLTCSALSRTCVWRCYALFRSVGQLVRWQLEPRAVHRVRHLGTDRLHVRLRHQRHVSQTCNPRSAPACTVRLPMTYCNHK
jgi:hypothetical protein